MNVAFAMVYSLYASYQVQPSSRRGGHTSGQMSGGKDPGHMLIVV